MAKMMVPAFCKKWDTRSQTWVKVFRAVGMR